MWKEKSLNWNKQNNRKEIMKDVKTTVTLEWIAGIIVDEEK